ncbi:hypothetical protein [Azospirillum brasilense]|uniref:hypothetical protein n=1 Tax=Azospirillum brasilense TaxID=192 RepID=UPI000E6912C7|nr:hypothetical protein [Azospirillum brasilense]NUB24295.1 hypothetical protein [Azospirillum brasilense]NUB30095.1 hypothetical protein [Azospirillum brasilense]RIW04954.1 hypothetical protein D2T81_08955 [Azospirillum brasilense]
MRDIPIIFSAPMVRALLDGRKTQTRRILKPQPSGKIPRDASWEPDSGFKADGRAGKDWSLHSPYLNGSRLLHATAKVRCAVGDRLWVRENFSRHLYDDGCWYWADGNVADLDSERIRPSIHMPRWASRLALVVEQVRVERLQDISEADAKAEGAIFTDFGTYTPNGTMSVDGGKTFHPFKPRQHDGWHFGWASRPDECMGSARGAFANLWRRLHGEGAWAANPWVAALTFRVIRSNIDAIPSQEDA